MTSSSSSITNLSCLSWSTSHLFMATLFAYSARVQLNDPDWQIWFAAYAFASILCIQLAAACYIPSILSVPRMMPSPSSIAGGLSVVAAGAMVVNFVREKAVSFSVRTEVGREAGGLLIMTLWMSFSSMRSPDAERKMSQQEQQQEQQQEPSAFGICLYMLLPVLSSAIMLSAYYIPTYYLDVNDTVDHCNGLGFDAFEVI
eukprot:CAMPEP_0196206438 /NCGR_PEP_ID=MMETSP0912-20130531/7817_1 /TAXON_ID=49265 /ORGANISM="Thalassiosira rotula, Strain GSO102" /LENGTH=200 /DNA_ID=CAMNT_0041480983 /DNA_START=98 /DNA_END=700 /DNA_ORIENTATION=+